MRKPTRAVDAVGKTFGRLTLLYLTSTKNRKRYGRFQCACGSVSEREVSSVVRGKVCSCGCAALERIQRQGFANKVHGLTGSKEHNAWGKMIARCNNPTDKSFKNYGGRGITVCDRWRHSFVNFLADMGKAPTKSHSLDRIDVNGNYEPGNCRWATPKEQGRNTRKTRRTANGTAALDVVEAANLGICPNTLGSRISRGMSVDKAVNTPVRRIKASMRNQLIRFNGREQTMSKWAEEMGISMKLLSFRLSHWTLERALTQAPRNYKGRR